jgi:hypothetical protein
MNEKPVALRLADNLYAEYRGFSCVETEAAAELRRQHAEIERLRGLLQEAREYLPTHHPIAESLFLRIAQALAQK